jgi:hypothetical protein
MDCGLSALSSQLREPQLRGGELGTGFLHLRQPVA